MLYQLSIFTIALLGFIMNRKSALMMLIAIEIMLLSATLIIVTSSSSMDDILGEFYSIIIICIAGAESALGLGIVISFYRLRSSIISV